MANPTAAMLVIGDEILSGRTRDANMYHLAGQLNGAGIDLKEVRVVSDRQTAIVDAVRALSRRGEALRPDRPYRYEIPLSRMAITIPAGHRLRLEITSSAFPSYARNLASGEDRLFGRSLRSARQTVHWSPLLSTRLELPDSLDVLDVEVAA